MNTTVQIADGSTAPPKALAVLVPSYNSAATIESTLRAILDRQDELRRHIDFVMLSDEGSRDDTVAIAERVWGDGPVPLVVRRAERNVGEYRNVNGAFAAMPAHIEWVLITPKASAASCCGDAGGLTRGQRFASLHGVRSAATRSRRRSRAWRRSWAYARCPSRRRGC